MPRAGIFTSRDQGAFSPCGIHTFDLLLKSLYIFFCKARGTLPLEQETQVEVSFRHCRFLVFTYVPGSAFRHVCQLKSIRKYK
jgi:hypothetical protein